MKEGRDSFHVPRDFISLRGAVLVDPEIITGLMHFAKR